MLDGRFLSLYLYGSLAMGDFDPARSDIDFVVVTQEELGEGMIEELQQMHDCMWSTGSAWAKKLEGVYLPQAALRQGHR